MGRKTIKSKHISKRDVKQARKMSANPDESFLNNLNIGDPDSSNHKRGFGSPDEIVDWFHPDRSDDWRQRD